MIRKLPAALLVLLLVGLVAACNPDTGMNSDDELTGDIPASGLQVFLIALEDGGQAGPEIGCGDSVVGVDIDFVPTTESPLADTLGQLLALDQQGYPDADLNNALYDSQLEVLDVTMVDDRAIIELQGDLNVGGVCDGPRIEAQLLYTARQFDDVNSVDILINGQPMEEALNGGEDSLLTPGAVLDAQDWLAEELGVPVEEIEIVAMEEVEWQDTCLGLGGPAESCLATEVPGWRVIFDVDGEQYEVRTDVKGEGFRSPEVDS